MADDETPEEPLPKPEPVDPSGASSVCPVCGGPLLAEKCKLVCRSETCIYRIVFNCAEF